MLWEILKAGRTNNSDDLFTRLAAEGISGAMNTSTVSGISPLVMPNCSGKPLISCIITGNTVQNGTPTTGTPVDVLGCGDYDSETGMYKIPVVTRGNEQTITTPIYLPTPLYSGEVLMSDGSRDVKWDRLVLTGDEAITMHKIFDNGSVSVRVPSLVAKAMSRVYCTHLDNVSFFNLYNLCNQGVATHLAEDYRHLYFLIIGFTTEVKYKEFFAAQYSAGTPVTVWYQLAEPTTETVTVPRIQTIRSSAATLSIDTQVQPENVTVKYRR